MFNLSIRLQSRLARYWASFSYVGLAVATLFFAASLTPSLLPRHFAAQGLLSGVALAVGYGVKARLVWKKFVSAEDCAEEYERWRK